MPFNCVLQALLFLPETLLQVGYYNFRKLNKIEVHSSFPDFLSPTLGLHVPMNGLKTHYRERRGQVFQFTY